MRSVFFNAVTSQSVVGDGTVGDLVDWLEKYVNIIFPDNGIEYWADQRLSGHNSLKRFQKVPLADGSDDGIHHVACYPRHGTCEGTIIEVALYLRSDVFKSLTWIKSFGSLDECWTIARAIGDALSSILCWSKCPEIVEMAGKLPKANSWHRHTSLTEEVEIHSTSEHLTVTTPSGIVFDDRSWKDKGLYAHHDVEARVKDWKSVLTAMKVRFTLTNETHFVVDDLPGYVFSNRGVEGCSGVYVFPPGKDKHDDRQYLGYFVKHDEAIAAARSHKEGSTPPVQIELAA